MRAAVVAAGDGFLRVRLVEVDHPSRGAEVGAEVGGSWDGTLPRGGEGPAVAPGDDVLVSYSRGDADRYPGCVDYEACTSERCDPLRSDNLGPEWDRCDSECIEETRDVCSEHLEEALLGGTFRLAVPWGHGDCSGGPFGWLRHALPDGEGSWDTRTSEPRFPLPAHSTHRGLALRVARRGRARGYGMQTWSRVSNPPPCWAGEPSFSESVLSTPSTVRCTCFSMA